MRHGSLYSKLIQSKEWRQLRAQVLSEQPLCQWCKAKGYYEPAQVVHHLVEVETGRTVAAQRELMFKRSNCIGLCKRCHSAYHNGQGYHSTEKVKERQQQRQEAWIDQMKLRFKGG